MKKELPRITARGMTRTIGQWEKITGIGYNKLRLRFLRGWTPEEIIGDVPFVKKTQIRRLETFSGIDHCLVPVMMPDSTAVGQQAMALKKHIRFTEEDAAKAMGCSESKAYLLLRGRAVWKVGLIMKFEAFIHTFVNDGYAECSGDSSHRSNGCLDSNCTGTPIL
jgi:hypothetical protein